jgi:hypothetical protein
MDIALDVLNGVIDYLMLKLRQPIVGLQGIGVQGGTGLNMLANFGLKRFFLRVRDNGSADDAVLAIFTTLQDSHHGSLVLASGSGDFHGAWRSAIVLRAWQREQRVCTLPRPSRKPGRVAIGST